MKRLFRVLIALGVVSALLLVALIALLPRLAESEEVRRQLMAAGSQATGRDVRFGELDVALMPPGLRLTEAQVSGPSAEDSPFLEGATIDLRLSWLSLLSLSVVVDSLVVEGATLRMVRGEDGLELPIPEADPTDPAEGAEPAPAEEAAASADDGGGLDLAVRDVRLRDTRIIFEDRTTEPPVLLEIADLAGKAEGKLLPRRLDFDFSGVLSSGGGLRLRGNAGADGAAELDLDLTEVQVDPFAVYAPPSVGGMGGKLSGAVSVEQTGAGGDSDRIVFDLRLEDGDFALDDVAMQGTLLAEGTLLDPTGSPSGDFDIDATQAALRYAEFFAKPAGTPARANGKLRAGPDGALRLEETRLKVDSLEADVDADIGDSTELKISAKPFDVGSLSRLVPAAAEKKIEGRASLRQFSVRQTGEKLAFGGEAELSEIRVAGADAPPIEVSGVFVGGGNHLASEALRVVVGEQTLPIALRLDGLDTNPRFHAKGKAEDLDSQALLAALADTGDKLSGPLDLDFDLRGPLSEAAASAVAGHIAFEVKPGRLRGVSLLQSISDQLGFIGQAALALGEQEGGRSVKRLYGDEFEVLSGRFDIERGVARTRDLQLIYRDYDVKLVGDIALENMGLDLSGTLTLNEDAKQALSEGGDAKPKRVIRLAHVGGTADAPKVTVRADEALSIARGVRPDKVEDLSEEIDERLGEGAGKQVLDALEGFLGGGRR
jgi:uncharacterized protein involved in outer membrane biogenesis